MISKVYTAIKYGRNAPGKTAHRVCTRQRYGQTLDSQLEQLRAAGCSSRNRGPTPALAPGA